MQQLVLAKIKCNYSTVLALIITGLFFSAQISYAHFLDESESSFALEYKELRLLLQKVNSEQSAINYKLEIKQQIDKLKQNQATGEQSFASMSKPQQQLFVKKFQNNRFHCGEVTQVMDERQRILLQPELSKILRDLLIQIP